MPTANHQQTDRQTERLNRVIGDILRSTWANTPKRCSSIPPVVEFALKNADHTSSGFTPLYVNCLTHPRVPLTLPVRGFGIGGGEMVDWLADNMPVLFTKYKRVSRNAVKCLTTCALRNGG